MWSGTKIYTTENPSDNHSSFFNITASTFGEVGGSNLAFWNNVWLLPFLHKEKGKQACKYTGLLGVRKY